MIDLIPTTSLAFLGSLGWPEMIILGILGVLIFGKRLPQVGKSVGQSIVEFKKGLSGVQDEVDDAVKTSKRLEDPAAKTDHHDASAPGRAPGMTPGSQKTETNTPPHSA